MTLEEFDQAREGQFHGPLLALWLDRRGSWERAHEVAQEIVGREGAWVHAYLHRKEGDTLNAGYWYRQAGRPAAQGDFQAEANAIVEELFSLEGLSLPKPGGRSG